MRVWGVLSLVFILGSGPAHVRASAESDATAQGWRTTRARSGDTILVSITGLSAVRPEVPNPAIELRLAREVAIGESGTRMEELFGQVNSTLPLPDGSIVVYDGITRDIRMFNPAGNYMKTVARQGSGPGEVPPQTATITVPPGTTFVDMTISAIVGDAAGFIYAWNLSGRVVNRYDRSGNFDRAIPVSLNEASNRMAGGVDADGLVHTLGTLDQRSGRCSDTVQFRPCPSFALRMRIDGTIADTLFAPEVRSPTPIFTYTRPNSAISRLTARVPFGAYPLVEYSRIGYWISAAPEKYAITLHRPRGGPVRITMDAKGPAISANERRASYEQMVSGMRAAQVASLPSPSVIPEVKPPIRAIRSDADGRIWVMLHMPGERVPAARSSGSQAQPERWTERAIAYDIFSPGGDYLGRLRMPTGMSFIASTGPYVWLAARTALDETFLVRMRIGTGSPANPAAAYWANGGR